MLYSVRKHNGVSMDRIDVGFTGWTFRLCQVTDAYFTKSNKGDGCSVLIFFNWCVFNTFQLCLGKNNLLQNNIVNYQLEVDLATFCSSKARWTKKAIHYGSFFVKCKNRLSINCYFSSVLWYCGLSININRLLKERLKSFLPDKDKHEKEFLEPKEKTP